METATDFENEDYDTTDEEWSAMKTTSVIISHLAIIIGIIANLIAAVVIIKCRLWIQHEGYFYLVAIFITNVFILVFHFIPSFFALLNSEYNLYNLNDIICKLSVYVRGSVVVPGWLTVAFLVDVYLYGKLSEEGEGRCKRFAGKFCTLLTAKIVTFVVSFLFAVGNVWTLIAYRYESFGHFEDCITSGKWILFSIQWLYITGLLSLIFPVVILFVLVIMISCNRKSITGPNKSLDRASFISNNETDEERRLKMNFFKISICLAIVTILIEFVVNGIAFDAISFNVLNMDSHLISQMVRPIGLSVIPIICLLLANHLREKLLRKCCKKDEKFSSDDDDRSYILKSGTTKIYDSASSLK